MINFLNMMEKMSRPKLKNDADSSLFSYSYDWEKKKSSKKERKKKKTCKLAIVASQGYMWTHTNMYD